MIAFQVDEVRQKLAESSGFQYELIINENRSHMVSILERKANKVRLSLHRMFLEAPENVIEALAKYVKALDKAAFSVVRSYISANLPRFDYSHKLDSSKLAHKGKYYDLQELYEQVNQEYFSGSLKLSITWLDRIPKKKASRIVYGQYFPALRLIKINKLLDERSCPKYFIAFVIYHEMLHNYMPSYVDEKGVTRIHGKEFKELEKQFRFYEQAKDWELQFRSSFFHS